MDPAEATRLVAKHQAGVLVDAQLLLLLLVGEFDRSSIRRFKRIASETAETDFDLIRALLRPCQRLLVTPHILTEVDDLAESLKPIKAFREWLRDYVLVAKDLAPLRVSEKSVRSVHASAERDFPRLGLADCAVIRVARQRRLVITRDFDLFRQLSSERLAVVNFDHVRASEYGWQKELQALFPPPRPR